MRETTTPRVPALPRGMRQDGIEIRKIADVTDDAAGGEERIITYPFWTVDENSLSVQDEVRRWFLRSVYNGRRGNALEGTAIGGTVRGIDPLHIEQARADEIAEEDLILMMRPWVGSFEDCNVVKRGTNENDRTAESAGTRTRIARVEAAAFKPSEGVIGRMEISVSVEGTDRGEDATTGQRNEEKGSHRSAEFSFEADDTVYRYVGPVRERYEACIREWRENLQYVLVEGIGVYSIESRERGRPVSKTSDLTISESEVEVNIRAQTDYARRWSTPDAHVNETGHNAARRIRKQIQDSVINRMRNEQGDTSEIADSVSFFWNA